MALFLSWEFLKHNSKWVRSLIECNSLHFIIFSFSLNLILHFSSQLSNLAFSPTQLTVFSGTIFRIGSSGFSNSEFSTCLFTVPTWYMLLSSQQWLLLFQFVFIFSQYSNSFHSAILLLSINFIIIFLIFFFLLFYLFLFCFSFCCFYLFLFYFLIFPFLFLFLI
jgi:hypothetical protein